MASLLHRWTGAKGHVRSIAISPDGHRTAAGCHMELVILSTSNGKLVLGPLRGHTQRITAVAFSPNGDILVSGSADNSLRIWDTETGKAMREPLCLHRSVVSAVAFTPNGRLFISGSYDHTIRLWDAHSGESTGQLIDIGGYVESIAVSPDSTKIAAASNQQTIKMYDAATSTLLFQCAENDHFGYSIAFSPDGRCIAAGLRDCTVRLWDGATGHAIGDPFEGHTDAVSSVAFSPDGRYIASGSYDNTMRIWNVEDGIMISEPLVDIHTVYVGSVAFTPDGTRLVSGSSDPTVRFWDLQPLFPKLGPLYAPISRRSEEATCLISDTNAVLRIAGSGDLVSLTSHVLKCKFKNSSAGTDLGLEKQALLIYNQNAPPNPIQQNLSYRLVAAGDTTILFIATNTNAMDPSASVATTKYSATTVGGPAFFGFGKWFEAN